MHILPTAIDGCYQLVPDIKRDERGYFVKVFHQALFRDHGLETGWAEEYYSASRRGVLRGLHFQSPPHDHAKLIYCVQGSVIDAAVDLRAGSPTYGQHLMMQLDAACGHMLYLAPGMAHGFYTLSEEALMMYKVSSTHAPLHDHGIRWDSAGIVWPDQQPILSARDRALAPLAAFETPFIYGQPQGVQP